MVIHSGVAIVNRDKWKIRGSLWPLSYGIKFYDITEPKFLLQSIKVLEKKIKGS